ncbi:DUF4160 domain-containing protein [Martelella endophytica]|uniref:DUF4160 domain-containing protein n=1 Tax=Martelella endophytica TaxID=1486262 RepID=A0A0D5LSH5_MAREN|nr:DUF4160 domain-containing protein [Martelella endophytica]AJY47036.1 hypothetical protein TM49_17295 [Martelella endophytica]
MPTIVKIGNIAIQIYADDHNPPHFHVVTPDHEAAVLLDSLELMVGSMDRKSLKAALEWARDNKEQLINEWNRLNP